MSQYKNDVKARHMATNEVEMFHVEELTLFIGDKESAEAAALLDNNSYYIDSIIAHKGDPFHRTSMEFMIQWSDGEIKWDRWNTAKENFSKTSQPKKSKVLPVKRLSLLDKPLIFGYCLRLIIKQTVA